MMIITVSWKHNMWHSLGILDLPSNFIVIDIAISDILFQPAFANA
jgi:hypothetical protein